MAIETDIKKFLIRNSLVTYGLAVITLCSIVGAFWYGKTIINEARKVIYIVKTDGEIIPLQLADQREAATIEMKHHLVMFVDYYYNVDQFNYERKTAKALWLGDLKQDYANRKNGGYYSVLIQLNTVRIAELPAESIELLESDNRMQFKIIIQLIEQTGDTKKQYLIYAKGTLKQTARHFPYNPHGFFIENYLEEKVLEVK